MTTHPDNPTAGAGSDKLLDKLAKLKRQAEGEAALGNSAAAEAFAEALNRMMLKHQITMVEVEDAAAREAAGAPAEPVVWVHAHPEAHGFQSRSARCAWSEDLAGLVAHAHMCKLLVVPGSNRVVFFGLESHARCAEYSWGTLVAAALRMSLDEQRAYYNDRGRQGGTAGFRAAWLNAFVRRIGERLREARERAFAEAQAESGINRETALVRINNAVARVAAEWNQHKWSKASAVRGPSDRFNRDGDQRGTAAANRINLGQRGVGAGSSPRGSLKG